MKTKQIIGIVVAALMFIIVCVTSVATKKLFGDVSSDLFKSTSSTSTTPDGDYVGVLKVEGTMTTAETAAGLFEAEGYSHSDLIDTIDDYMEDDNNVGMLLYVNSPGGTVNAADELYLKLMEYKKETKNPIYVYMADEACSGGYYVSVAGDKIYGNRNTWTGSIGVYMELANYKALFDKLGIKTTYIKAGANKTMGSATQELTEEQSKILQSIIDESYEQFIEVIVAGRKNMTEQEIRKAADGRIYTAKQAKDVGLIDDVKFYDEVIDIIYKDLGENIEIYEEDGDELSALFGDLFSDVKSFLNSKDKSETEQILEMIEKDGSGVPMYYAKPQ
ncbi:MAG: signal peptide peptidase SppA [Lachnospiraceae bacterium]|nr:signal peptide peptidase SppA [Lachnospiraceae bacterium]